MALTERTGCSALQAARTAITSTSAARAPRAGAGRRRSGASASGAWRSRKVLREATKPAHSSAGTALPGTYHVQSIAECTPKTITTTARVANPTRSASQGNRSALRRTPSTRAAAARNAATASSESPMPTQPRSASTWTA